MGRITAWMETENARRERAEPCASPFAFKIELEGNRAHLELSGRLGPERFDAFEAGLAMLSRQGAGETTIGLAALEQMDTFAVGILCGFARAAQREGRVTRVFGEQGRIEKKLERAASRGQFAATLVR